MKISLQTFEHEIDEIILERGLNYFKKGLVGEPEEISRGTFECVVEGSDEYVVRFTLKHDTLTDYECSCPYEHGPVCKHVAAVIFYLKKGELGLVAKDASAPKKSPPAKRKKKVAEQVDELLEKLSHHNLKQYVREQSDKDASFRRLFLANFAHLVMPDSQELYAKQVKATLKAAADRHGFIGYRESTEVARDVDVLLQRAHALVADGNYVTTMHIAFAVLEEMVDALGYADDSNGSIGGCIEEAMSVLSSLAKLRLPDELRIPFFDHCLKLYRSGKFEGWDWHSSIISIAASLCQNRQEAQPIFDLLEKVKPDCNGYDWDQRKVQGILLQLIRRFDGHEKADLYIAQNLGNSDFRKAAIEQAIQRKEYVKAISLAEEGVRIDDKDKPGLANQWREMMLGIYILQRDNDNTRQMARYLFLNSNGEKERYFGLMKKLVPATNWDAYVAQLIHDINSQSRWFNYSAIGQIYIWESRWSDLLDVVKKNPMLNVIEAYESYLVTDYADVLAALYQTAIFKYLENNVSRSHYQTACRYLKRVVKMGARERVNEAIDRLKALYPMRRALMEELQKV